MASVKDVLWDAGCPMKFGRVMVNHVTKESEPGYFIQVREDKLRKLLPHKVLRLSCSVVAKYDADHCILQIAVRHAEKEL